MVYLYGVCLGQEVTHMANEDKKDFNAMLCRDNGMPKIQIVTDEGTIRKYGGDLCIYRGLGELSADGG